MDSVRSRMAKYWCAASCLGILALFAGCSGADDDPGTFTLAWTFVNNSAQPVTFAATASGGGLYNTSAAAHASGTPSSSTHDYGSGTISIDGSVFSGAGALLKDSGLDDIAVSKDQVTTVHAIWDGTNLVITTQTVAAITRWKLGSLIGTTTGSWSDNFSTGNGTVTITFPDTAYAGETVPVTARFAASVTYGAGFTGAETLNMSMSGDGLTATNSTSIGTATIANPTLSGSALVIGSWTVPSSGPADKLTILLNAGFQTFHGGAWGLNPTVTYTKVTP